MTELFGDIEDLFYDEAGEYVDEDVFYPLLDKPNTTRLIALYNKLADRAIKLGQLYGELTGADGYECCDTLEDLDHGTSKIVGERSYCSCCSPEYYAVTFPTSILWEEGWEERVKAEVEAKRKAEQERKAQEELKRQERLKRQQEERDRAEWARLQAKFGNGEPQ